MSSSLPSPTPNIQPLERPQTLLILTGIVGSGKSTLANAIEAELEDGQGWVRVNQDELGDRIECEQMTRGALSAGLSVIIDRQNFNRSQRKVWVDIGREYSGVSVRCLFLPTSIPECRERLMKRKEHPTIPNPQVALSVLNKVLGQWQDPQYNECFDILYRPPFPLPQSLSKPFLLDLMSKMESLPPAPNPQPFHQTFQQEMNRAAMRNGWAGARGGGAVGGGGAGNVNGVDANDLSRNQVLGRQGGNGGWLPEAPTTQMPTFES